MDGADRTHEATPHRLQKAYAEGQGPATPELTLVATLALSAATLSVMQADLGRMFARWARALWSPDTFASLASGEFTVPASLDGAALASVLGPALALPLVAIALVAAQKGPLWRPSAMSPDPSRLLPRMPVKDVAECGETLARGAARTLLAAFGAGRLALVTMPHGFGGPVLVPAEPMDALRRVLGELAVLALMLSVADYLWRRHRFFASLRMSAAEVKAENRSLEGDPRVKGERNRRMEAVFEKRAHSTAGPARRVVLWSGDRAALVGVWADPAHVPLLYSRATGPDAARLCDRGRATGLPVHWVESLDGVETAVPGRSIPESLFPVVAAVHKHVLARMRAGGRS